MCISSLVAKAVHTQLTIGKSVADDLHPFFQMLLLVAGLQAYYLAAPFAVERAPTKALDTNYKRRKDVEVALLTEYPVKGLVFEAGESLHAMANLVGSACRRLQVAFLSWDRPESAQRGSPRWPL